MGLAHIAFRTGVPIVPFGLTGSECLQNPLRVLKPNALLRLKIGRPFVVKADETGTGKSVVSKLTEEIMIRIANLLPEDRRGKYSDLIDLEPIQTVNI